MPKPETPARSALLVVDVQKDFCPGGALAVPHGDRVVPVLNGYMADATRLGVPIYASRDWHPVESRHFKARGGSWPPHCVQGTDGARFHPALRLPPSAVVVTKGQEPDDEGYSALEGRTSGGRALLPELRENGITHLYVGGLATDYCVLESVLSARSAGIDVTVLADAIAGVDLHDGDSARALARMREAGAKVVDSASLSTAR